MIPAGYMAKHIAEKTDWLKADNVIDVYSVGDCISKDFTDYVDYCKHNGFWFFDSPQIIKELSEENPNSISLNGTTLFYYEMYRLEYHANEPNWREFQPLRNVPVQVVIPEIKTLMGFDVVNYITGSMPEDSPLSCNSLAESIKTNSHCLLDTFEEAKQNLENGELLKGEPGPYRIFAVYLTEWF